MKKEEVEEAIIKELNENKITSVSAEKTIILGWVLNLLEK